jgi:peptidoglycan/xylan/chitin deacetylase (PgdA/CDA1 family)
MLTEKMKTIRFKFYQILERGMTALITPFISGDYLERRIKPAIIAPYYHIVSDERVAHVIHLYPYRNMVQFKIDLDYFLKNYNPIEPFELIKAIKNGRKLKKKAFILSFDDGFREIHDVVAPILKQKGVPAIFFLTTGFLDNRVLGHNNQASLLIERYSKLNHIPKIVRKVKETLGSIHGKSCDIRKELLSSKSISRETLDRIATVLEVDFDRYLCEVKPYLTTKQVESLIHDGFHIGAHSINHFHYGTLTPLEQLTQTRESMDLIRRKFNLNYAFYAFPYTDHGVKSFHFEAMVNKVDLFFGTSTFCSDRVKNIVQRFPMEKNCGSAQKILHHLYVRHQVRELFGLNRKKR